MFVDETSPGARQEPHHQLDQMVVDRTQGHETSQITPDLSGHCNLLTILYTHPTQETLEVALGG